jgi:hypothetical protein
MYDVRRKRKDGRGKRGDGRLKMADVRWKSRGKTFFYRISEVNFVHFILIHKVYSFV